MCLVSQSCPTLCDPLDCNLPGSSVHGMLQARILEWVALSSSSGSFLTQILNPGLHIAGRFFTIWATDQVVNCHLRDFAASWPSWPVLPGLLHKSAKKELLLPGPQGLRTMTIPGPWSLFTLTGCACAIPVVICFGITPAWPNEWCGMEALGCWATSEMFCWILA